MSYNPNIPISTDPLTQSELQLKANFQAINMVFADNHVGLTNSQTTAGMHNTMTIRPQSGNPATTVDQVALYSKLVSTIPELFFRPSNNQTPIQLTYPSIKADSSKTQYSFIAGPFIVYGGLINNPTQGQIVTLAPGTSLLYVDLIATNVNTFSPLTIFVAAATTLNTPANSFTVKYPTNIVPPSTFDLYYFAIGV